MRYHLNAAKVLYIHIPTAIDRMAATSLCKQFSELYLSEPDEYFVQSGDEFDQLYGDQKDKSPGIESMLLARGR
jgi:hypothetical protein